MSLSEGSKIHETAVIFPGVTIGKNVYIGPGCIIGAPAEHKAFWNQDTGFSVTIHDNAVIHGNVTIDAGTINETVIGEGVWLMKGVHIGHDVIINRDCTLSPHVIIGGHCIIEEENNLGMGAIVHQRVTVPPGCMIGMGAIVTKKTELWGGGVFAGNPAAFLRWNDKKVDLKWKKES